LELLLQLIETIVELLRSNPRIVHAALSEHYRGTAEERILKRLSQWQPEIPEALFEEEFRGALNRLERDGSAEKQSLDQLIEKGSLEAVPPETKEILRGRRSKNNTGSAERKNPPNDN
jgi:FKBP-type peptidyl-prolyl cis-trans isomerase (trigger factor)